MLAYEVQERDEGRLMVVPNGEMSFEMLSHERPEVPQELVLNTTLFDIFGMEPLEAPEEKHWLPADSLPLDTIALELPEEMNLLTSCTGTGAGIGTTTLGRLTPLPTGSVPCCRGMPKFIWTLMC